MSTKKLVIGLDFGTTFSGVAYCDDVAGAKGTAEIQLIQSWPGISNMGNTEKVPSRIAYGISPNDEVLWGNLIKPNIKAKVQMLMKLRLDEGLRKSQKLRLLLAFLNIEGVNIDDSDDEDGPTDYPGKEPVDIVADYLTEIRKHTYKDLTTVYGASLQTLNRELVVTVPAVWSERAKDLTIQAVAKANFDVSKISMVTEPEAAAIYTLKDMKEGPGKDQIQVGDCFVVCDAGGGTVDLISYRITAIHPVLKVEEAAIGSGDKCGATYVDKEFMTWLEKRIGSEAFNLIPPAKRRHGSALLSAFEIAKTHFQGKDESFEVNLPKECKIEDDEEKRIEGRELTITSDDLKEIFDPCVNRTLEFIDGQVTSIIRSGSAKPKMVICVGGFGRNEYLYSKIVDYCSEQDISTRKPQFPWSAVARGAVCRGLEGPQAGLVAVRLARKHYGTYASERFDPARHDSEDMFIDEYDGNKYAKGQMTWLVRKGERLTETTPKVASFECCAQFRPGGERNFGAFLVGCDEDDAPQRYAHKDAYNICRVTADLSDVPESSFTRCRSLKTGEYFMAEFKLEATFIGGEIHWTFVFKGKEYGSTSVSYNT